MKSKLKRLDQQVLVITGASSGIGLVTARMAAARGARVLLAARNEEALAGIVGEIERHGGIARYVVADVGSHEDVERIAEAAIQHFGGFDTWVNNAGAAIYGTIEATPIADQRRLFETNYWGVVYGSLAAVRHLRERGGALINIGSVFSDRAAPLQGVYSASKHAVKGFTDALRMELEGEGAPVAVTLIKPAAIDTPYMDHAKNLLPNAPKNPPPWYAPEVVAETILRAAERPLRDVTVGGAGRLITVLGAMFPRLTDRVMEWTMPSAMRSREPPRAPEDSNLYDPSQDGRERSHYHGHVLRSSLYTRAAQHPYATLLIGLGVGLGASALWQRRGQAGDWATHAGR